jgi:hypothetical protein
LVLSKAPDLGTDNCNQLSQMVIALVAGMPWAAIRVYHA